MQFVKKNNGIGFEGGLPWHLKQDLKYFKNVTTQFNTNTNVVILEEKLGFFTCKTFTKRINVVITRNEEQSYLESFSKYDSTFVSNSIENIYSILSGIKGVKHNIYCNRRRNLQTRT